jgi:anti-sigma-K factor RskA
MKNQFSFNACPSYEAVLEDYLEGQLNASDLKDLRAHLAVCSGCSEALTLAEGSMRLLRYAEPALTPGPQFSRLVMARIRANESARSEERASFWRPLVAMSWRFAATAAVALVLLLTYDVVGNTNRRPEVAVVSQDEANLPETAGIFTSEPVAPPATRGDVLLLVAGTSDGSH